MDSFDLNIPHIKQDWWNIRKWYWKKRTCWLACLKMFLEHEQRKSPSFDELIEHRDDEFVCLSFLDWTEKRYSFFTEAMGWLHYWIISIARKYWYNGMFERTYTKENAFDKIESQLKWWYFVMASVNRYPEYKWKRRWHLIILRWIKRIWNKKWLIVNDPAKKDWWSLITEKTFLKNFNYCSIVLKKDAEEMFLANYPTFIEKISFSQNSKIYIHVHENEELAYQESLDFIKERWWTILAIHQNKERFLRYEINWTTWEKIFLRTDPNRIFDQDNLQKTVIERNLHLPKELYETAFRQCRYIRDYVLSKVDEENPVYWICVHNNKLLDINELSKEECVSHISTNMPSNAFIISPDNKYFEKLKALDINCLHYPKWENDWSLRDFHQSKWKAFFTVESWYDDKQTFRKLLEALDEILK